MITHLTDGFYKIAYWDAVIGHSQGAIDDLEVVREPQGSRTEGGLIAGTRTIERRKPKCVASWHTLAGIDF
jgi:hypothetical protein